MSLLRFEGVTRELGTLRVLEAVEGAVAVGERIGLVGLNGSGKTTLLRLAAGLDAPDAGRLERKRGLIVSLLAQEAGLEPIFASLPDLRSYVRSGAARLEAMEERLHGLEGRGAEAVESREYAELQHTYEALGGYTLDQRVDEALSGLGFARDQWARPPASLSGGEQTRAALARMVTADPDLLLLDEPTNHLDLAALEWLESALLRRTGALLVASHDRAFLDAVPERIWELRDSRLASFRGGYSGYVLQREECDARARREADRRANEIAREARLSATYRAQRKFAKMHEHEARLERLEPIAGPRDGRRLRLPSGGPGGTALPGGSVTLSLRHAVFGLAGRRLVAVPRLDVRRGERIGVVGPNGAGKTTLLRTLAGDLLAVEGGVHLDRFAEIGYLAQLRTAKLPGETILDALLSRAPLTPGQARAHLARFLFRGDDVFKSVAVLSGGERSRLELALLAALPANLLLLDEPTNHLDIPAREALEAFLRATEATLVLVSHDRRLLDGTCQRLLVIEPGRPGAGSGASPGAEATAVPFEGTYSAWRATSSSRSSGPLAAPNAASGAPASPPLLAAVAAAARREPNRSSRPAARSANLLSKDAYRRHRKLVDADLTRLGLRRTQIELALADASVQANYVELRRLTSELADIETALGEAEDAWLTLEERAPR